MGGWEYKNWCNFPSSEKTENSVHHVHHLWAPLTTCCRILLSWFSFMHSPLGSIIITGDGRKQSKNHLSTQEEKTEFSFVFQSLLSLIFLQTKSLIRGCKIDSQKSQTERRSVIFWRVERDLHFCVHQTIVMITMMMPSLLNWHHLFFDKSSGRYGKNFLLCLELMMIWMMLKLDEMRDRTIISIKLKGIPKDEGMGKQSSHQKTFLHDISEDLLMMNTFINLLSLASWEDDCNGRWIHLSRMILKQIEGCASSH